MVEYRNVKKEDAGELWEFLKKLDTETDFMMYEPGEREQCTSAAELSRDIEENVQKRGDFLNCRLRWEYGWLSPGRARAVSQDFPYGIRCDGDFKKP